MRNQSALGNRSDTVTSLSRAVLITESDRSWQSRGLICLDLHQAEKQRRSGSFWRNSAGGGRKWGVPAGAHGSRPRSRAPLARGVLWSVCEMWLAPLFPPFWHGPGRAPKMLFSVCFAALLNVTLNTYLFA